MSAIEKMNKQVYIKNSYQASEFGSLASFPCQALFNLSELINYLGFVLTSVFILNGINPGVHTVEASKKTFEIYDQ